MKRATILLLGPVLAGSAVSQTFENASFEDWEDPLTCSINSAADAWEDYTNSGLGPDEGTFSVCPHSIPTAALDGDTYSRHYAGGPTGGEGEYQIVSGLIPGATYTISYHYSGSNIYGGTADCRFHTFIDDVDVHQSPVFSSLDDFWTQTAFDFTATAAAHKIGFRAYTAVAGGGTGSAGLDGVCLSLADVNCGAVYCDTNPDNAADISIDTCSCGAGSINISMSGGPTHQPGYLLVGAANGVIVDPPGAAGDLCLDGDFIGRYVLDVALTDATGALSTDILNATTGGGGGGLPSPPGGNVCFPSCQTWHFQYWTRDGANPSRFSKAIQVTFQP